MTPEQLMENAKECQKIQRELHTLNHKECYLVISDKCFFRTSTAPFVVLSKEQSQLIRFISEAIKQDLIQEKKQKQEMLANPTEIDDSSHSSSSNLPSNST